MHVCAYTRPRARVPTCTHARKRAHRPICSTRIAFPQQQWFCERTSMLRYTYTGAGVWFSACSLNNPACNAPSYCHLRPLAAQHFSTLSHKRHDFRRNVIEHKMCILIFYTTFIWNISHSKKNSVRYCHKCENVFIKRIRYSCRILMVLEFSRQIFEKN